MVTDRKLLLINMKIRSTVYSHMMRGCITAMEPLHIEYCSCYQVYIIKCKSPCYSTIGMHAYCMP